MPWLLLLLLGPATAAAAEWIGPRPEGLAALELEQMLATHPLAPGENIKAVVLARNERSANLLVQVRDREPLHYHADSDITVFLLSGHGALRLGEKTFPVRAGDVLHIPRGMVHAYINQGPQPGVALVVYSPAPGPADRVLVAGPPPPPGRSTPQELGWRRRARAHGTGSGACQPTSAGRWRVQS